MSDTIPDRSAWLRCLAVLPATELQAVADRVPIERLRHRRVPRSGLAMLRLTEPNLGQDFFLGELPLALAEVTVEIDEGVLLTGAAQVMDDDEERATAMAIVDALAGATGPDADAARDLLRRGWQRVQAQDAERAGLLRATTVDFNRLEIYDDDD